MNQQPRFSTPVVFLVASVLGVLIAAADVAAPFGDDSAKSTIVLWLVASGVAGMLNPPAPIPSLVLLS